MALSRNILVAGVGNELLTDDGIGVHAVRELQRAPLPGVTFVEIGTAILHGLPFVEEANRVLVLDAAMGGRPPGTIYQFEPHQDEPNWAARSIHAMGLREAANLLLLDGKPVPPMTVLGVEPKSLAYGVTLSVAVQAALPRLVSVARETIARWSVAGAWEAAGAAARA